MFSSLHTHNLTYSLQNPHEVAITMISISQMKKLPIHVAIQVERSFYFGLGRRKAPGAQQESLHPSTFRETPSRREESVPCPPLRLCGFIVLYSGNPHLLPPEKFGLLPPSSSSPGAFAQPGVAGWGEGAGGKVQRSCDLTNWLETGAPKPPSVWQPRNSEEQRKP